MSDLWRRDVIIISILLAFSVFAAGIGIWRYQAKSEYGKAEPGPRIDRSKSEDVDSSSAGEIYKAATSGETSLEIPLSINEMHKLPLSGNKCVIVLVSVYNGPQLGQPRIALPLFDGQTALIRWDEKGSFQFPILVTDFCSVSAALQRAGLATGGDVQLQPPGQPAPAQTPQQKALQFLAEWSRLRSAKAERQSISQFRKNALVPAAEAALLLNSLVPLLDNTFAVRVALDPGKATLAGLSFTTPSAEHLAILGRPQDFEAVFKGRGETVTIKLPVKRTDPNEQNQFKTTALTIATRVVMHEIHDTTLFPADKNKDWRDQLLEPFGQTVEGPYSTAWVLGVDDCKPKDKRGELADRGYVRVFGEGDEWSYRAVLASCKP